MRKREYIKPIINKIVLDNTISLQMKSSPKDPPPRGRGGGKGLGIDGPPEPFQSPFGDKPFG